MLDLTFREVTAADLPTIIAILADDALGRGREDSSLPLNQSYVSAFQAIVTDPHQHFILAECDGDVVGFFQLSLIPGLSRKGAWRGNIESVRVVSSRRGNGIGRNLIRHAIVLCQERGCLLLQLTSDKRRGEAHRFYGNLGFVASHEGFKLQL